MLNDLGHFHKNSKHIPSESYVTWLPGNGLLFVVYLVNALLPLANPLN